VPDSPSPAETVTDVKDLLIAYAKQETVDPLRALPRYLVRGLGGSVLVGLGLLLLALSGLRALQTETGTTFTGSWSWAPYAIVLVGLAAAIALLARLITRTKKTT